MRATPPRSRGLTAKLTNKSDVRIATGVQERAREATAKGQAAMGIRDE